MATAFLWQNCSDFEAGTSLNSGHLIFSSVTSVDPRDTQINACNAASMAQVPGTSIFLGRMGVNLGANGCTQNERYTSAVYHRTINSNGEIDYTYSHNLLEIDQRIDSSTRLSHSYDPYPFYVGGQLFAVFECAIDGRGGSSVNVCVARVDEGSYKINPADIKILVRETYVDGHRLTAAVP